MLPVCDVQSRKIDTSFRLTKVGVSGVRKLIYVARPNNEIPMEPLVCTIDVSVDLPADQKGSHMSRNLEVIKEIISENTINPVTGIEDLAVQISKLLLERHEYATIANVSVEAEYFKNSVTPHGKKTTEIYTLIGGACDQRGQTIHKTVGVRCIGMAACPCAQENITQTLGCSKKWPVITHNQRNICSVVITMDENVSIEADDLIDLINESFSSPTFELLKRDDEAAVVINAHNNPKFVEDIVRVVLKKITDRYSDVPDDVRITVRSESEESIHKHNAFAERTTTMAELRR